MKPREKKKMIKIRNQNQVIKIKRKDYYLMKPRSREQRSEIRGRGRDREGKKKKKNLGCHPKTKLNLKPVVVLWRGGNAGDPVSIKERSIIGLVHYLIIDFLSRKKNDKAKRKGTEYQNPIIKIPTLS